MVFWEIHWHTQRGQISGAGKKWGKIMLKGGVIGVTDEIREYEAVVLLHPEMSEEERGKIRERIESSIRGKGGEITRVEVWGRKALAYEINHLREAFYLLYLFTLPAKHLRELQEAFSLAEEIKRFKIFRRASKG